MANHIFRSIEHIQKFKKKQARVVQKGKSKAKSAANTVQKPFRKSMNGEKPDETRRSRDNTLRQRSSVSQHRTSSHASVGAHVPQAIADDTGTSEKPLLDEHTDFPTDTPLAKSEVVNGDAT